MNPLSTHKWNYSMSQELRVKSYEFWLEFSWVLILDAQHQLRNSSQDVSSEFKTPLQKRRGSVIRTPQISLSPRPPKWDSIHETPPTISSDFDRILSPYQICYRLGYSRISYYHQICNRLCHNFFQSNVVSSEPRKVLKIFISNLKFGFSQCGIYILNIFNWLLTMYLDYVF